MSRSSAVLPYRVLGQGSVVPDPKGWALIVDGIAKSYLQDGSSFADWDANLSFRLERSFCIDQSALRTLALKGKSDSCELLVSATTAGGLAREVLWRARVPSVAIDEILVVLEPASDRLSKEVTLTSGLYLAERETSSDPLAPTLEGSRLWEMSERIRLEGGAARLPMYELSFARVFPRDQVDHAEFHVEVVDDPELDIEAALTVYLNVDRPDFVRLVTAGDPQTERRLWGGIVRRALAAWLLSEQADGAHAEASQSVAATMRRWAAMLWPDRSPEDIRDLMRNNCSLFESRIDSWLFQLSAPRPEQTA